MLKVKFYICFANIAYFHKERCIYSSWSLMVHYLARKQACTAKSLLLSLALFCTVSVVLKLKSRPESKDKNTPNRNHHTKDSEDISNILSPCLPERLFMYSYSDGIERKF